MFAPRCINYNRVYILIITWTYILLSVATAIAGDVTLSWGPPLTNEDGTPLTDLAGYKIYYGTSSGDYTYSIGAGNVITYQINGLQERLTYYFTVIAYDTSGNESIYSNEVSRYILQSPLDGLPPTVQTCEGRCGVQSQNGCGCDDQCELYGDCCPDYGQFCLAPQPGACGTGVDCPDYIDIYADLYQCDLSSADLFVADLSYACLQGAVLTNANLHGASLMYADLSGADLRGAFLRSTDLTGANLNGADLTGAVLENVIWWNTYCPDGTNSNNNKNTCAGHLF